MIKVVFVLLLVPALLFGQGQIIFQNNVTKAITNGATGQRAAISTTVGFYVNANPDASWVSPGWVIIGKTNLVVPGVFLGGIRDLPSSFLVGAPVAVQIRAWLTEGSYGSFEAAERGEPFGMFGKSNVIQVRPTPVGITPPPTILNGFEPFRINGPGFSPVPEPTTLALAGLGLAFLAFGKRVRRRKPSR